MADNERRSRRRRRKKRNVLYAPISFLIICVAMFFGMSVFFKVSVIEVSGAQRYSEQEIIDASQIAEGDNLFFINRSSAVSNIYSKLPYIEKAMITRKLPNRIVIDISESFTIAYVQFEGEYLLIDKNCKLLEIAGSDRSAGIIRVTGITPQIPTIGSVLDPVLEDAPKLEYLAAVLGQISAAGIAGDVRWVDVTNPASPSFSYTDRFTVRLGKNENLDYKFELLQKALLQLKEGDVGTIDLSNDKKAQFFPE